MKEKEKLEPQKRISPTSINCYLKCPRSYFYNYIAKLPTKPNIHMIKGTIVHKTLELFFKTYTKNLKETMLKYFENTFSEEEERIKTLELTEEQYKQMKEDCLFMVMDYYTTIERKIKGLIISEKVETERHGFYLCKPKLKEMFVEDKELHCCGFIDRVHKDFDGNITLGDYKTSSRYGIGIPEDYRRQLAIYALLYKSCTKLNAQYASVIFLRYGEEPSMEITPSVLNKARNTIIDVYNKTRSIDIEDYPLQESKLCDWCDNQPICSGEDDWKNYLRREQLKNIINKNSSPSVDTAIQEIEKVEPSIVH